jgi:hypothetical protein
VITATSKYGGLPPYEDKENEPFSIIKLNLCLFI